MPEIVTPADLAANHQAHQDYLADLQANHAGALAVGAGQETATDPGVGGGAAAGGGGTGGDGAAAPSLFSCPNPGPDIRGFMEELSTSLNAEFESGKLSQDDAQRINDIADQHQQTVDDNLHQWAQTDFMAEVNATKADMASDMQTLRDAHPDVDLDHLQPGDVPAAELTVPALDLAHHGVNIEAGFNTEVLDLKQEMIDSAREIVDFHSQTDAADPAQTDAYHARLDAMQAELDAARDAVDDRADKAHQDIDGAHEFFEKFDQDHPHGFQTSDTPDIRVPEVALADGPGLGGGYIVSGVADSDVYVAQTDAGAHADSGSDAHVGIEASQSLHDAPPVEPTPDVHAADSASA